MTTSDKDFSVDNIKKKYKFIEDSNFYKIYNEFNWDCRDGRYSDLGVSCFNGSSNGWTKFPEVTNILKKLYSNLYRIYVTNGGDNNDYFDDNEDEIDKMGYFYVKYWLYDQIFNNNLNDSKIKELYQGWNNYVKKEVEHKSNNPCIFYSLKKDEIKNIRKIYAFSTLLYQNVNKFKTNYNNNSKYMDYFGEGLDAFFSSINKCSSEKHTDNYCKEFKEFLNKCKDESLNAGILIYHGNNVYSPDDSNKYLLSIETYENKPLYIILKDKKMLNFLKTSNFLSNKNRNTIAATSAVGSAIALSSIFYYFYKFRPFGRNLRKGKGGNIVDINERAHDSLLHTPDTEHMPFQKQGI
ncbi:variable surface protein Vir21, putative [Plasmodium vivax]|uniref:Variable surface protein Vir21, putative n=1 Tax=Plasmodium vivax (strain Salvador I) TaxID=126793 RepID=A5KD94_PLAVS|nr:variable surface protein Vir21, putative [Plasmodium vivax]EDL42675.1 variable surface protein Vir21, putative [Plasmodium vivax]|eukprot:XP_001612468.1 variable surface protein Vir21 [Plasmodium vivax Sal-1]